MPSHGYDRSVGRGYNGEYSKEKLARSQEILSKFASRFPREKLLLAYSGGKDSIVAAHLAKDLGITESICETCFCSPIQVADFKKSAAQLGLNVTYKASLSWEWLAEHPEWIHPPRSMAGKFYAIRQQRTIKTHAKQHGFTAVVYGRRTEENTVRSSDYCTKDGLSHCHPIREWTTSEVWAYIHAHGLHYPSIYNHQIGKIAGNTPLNTLMEIPEKDIWKTMHSFDPNYVQNFAPFNADARNFLASL